jgi:hypothetical protein
MTDFIGQSRTLTTGGLSTAALSLGVAIQEVWAVLGVETSGCGFLPDRRPEILYERHLFHRFTNGRFDDGDISDPTPGGYGAFGAFQYERLNRAIARDRSAALRATSWGLGQLLGNNCAAAGVADVEAFVQTMSASEDGQLTAVATFIRSAGLADALRTHDWTSFARGYNGPTYARNQYDVRLRGEYQKLVAGLLPDLDVRTAQLYLQFQGFHPGPVDGILGTRTRSALVEVQIREGLPPTGEVDQTLLDRLAPPAPAAG